MEASKRLHSPPVPFQFSLRIRHPSIDPAEISRELQLEAEHCFKAGEPRQSESGIASVHSQSYWLANLDPAEWPDDLPLIAGIPEFERAKAMVRAIGLAGLDTNLLLITTRLLRVHGAFIRRLRAEGGEVGLLVELSAKKARGFTLTPQVSRALSDLGIAVDFELVNR